MNEEHRSKIRKFPTKICFRLVHIPTRFLEANDRCQSLGGALLQVDHLEEVINAIGREPRALVEASGEYRLDGFGKIQWFQRTNETLPTYQVNKISEGAHRGTRTMTLTIPSGKIQIDHTPDDPLPFLCQGASGVGHPRCYLLDGSTIPLTLLVDKIRKDPKEALAFLANNTEADGSETVSSDSRSRILDAEWIRPLIISIWIQAIN